MENKDFEKNSNQEELVNSEEALNDIDISSEETIIIDKEKLNDEPIIITEEKVLDEKEKVIKELQNKISFLYKVCGGIVLCCILALFILNFSKNNTMNNKVNETASKYSKHVQIANENLKKVEAEYANYKEKMKPYENLQQEEKEKKEAELKAEREKKEAEEKAKKEAEEKAKKEEEAKGYETGITYDELARNPDKNKGKKVTFTGTVIQVIRGNGEDKYRVSVKDDYKKVIYVTYIPKEGENKILENDKVIIRGVSIGEISYQSTMGGKISIPGIEAHSIEIK